MSCKPCTSVHKNTKGKKWPFFHAPSDVPDPVGVFEETVFHAVSTHITPGGDAPSLDTLSVADVVLRYKTALDVIKVEIGDCLSERMSNMPSLSNLSPLQGELFDIFYSRSEYANGLSNYANTHTTVLNILSDYSRLVKFADSHSRSQQLFRACVDK